MQGGMTYRTELTPAAPGPRPKAWKVRCRVIACKPPASRMIPQTLYQK